MKYRDHEKILREREKAAVEMKKRHNLAMERQKKYFEWEVAHRDRIMNNYADALGRQDSEIAILKQMLVRLGMDTETIERRIDEEMAKLNDDEVDDE